MAITSERREQIAKHLVLELNRQASALVLATHNKTMQFSDPATSLSIQFKVVTRSSDNPASIRIAPDVSISIKEATDLLALAFVLNILSELFMGLAMNEVLKDIENDLTLSSQDRIVAVALLGETCIETSSLLDFTAAQANIAEAVDKLLNQEGISRYPVNNSVLFWNDPPGTGDAQYCCRMSLVSHEIGNTENEFIVNSLLLFSVNRLYLYLELVHSTGTKLSVKTTIPDKYTKVLSESEKTELQQEIRAMLLDLVCQADP